MKKNALVTLLTDFGLEDVYVGVVKGAIACIETQLQVIDLTHQIPPQNIAAARFCLMNAYSYFPSPTVHLAVVDPGVGSKRRGVAISFAGGYLVGPDNGLFSGVLSLSPALAAVELNNSQYWLKNDPSTTFHGRDIFAPVAAHLARGVELALLGSPINPDTLVNLPPAELEYKDRCILGSIQYIDYFGNLIADIPAATVKDKLWQVVFGDLTIPSCSTYGDRNLGELMAIIGSHGWVEVAVNCGNAREILKAKWNDRIRVEILD